MARLAKALRALAFLLASALLGCAGASRAPSPALAIVTGEPAGEASASCSLAEWTAPWGQSYRMCMDAATAIEVARTDVYAFRIEDRKYSDRTWYLVHAHLANRLHRRIRESVGSGSLVGSADKPYAVLANGEVSVVLPGIASLDERTLMAAFEDQARAEAFASAWGAPVDRVISHEIASQPIYSVSLVQLIAAPERWAGKRVEVHGHLAGVGLTGSPTSLFHSREHAEALDFASSASVHYASREDAEAASPCSGGWVGIVGVVDRDHGGWPEITSVERLWATSLDGRRCLPIEPPPPPAQ